MQASLIRPLIPQCSKDACRGDSSKAALEGGITEGLSHNETGFRSPCIRPRSDPPNFGPIERGEKQTIILINDEN